MLNSTTLIERIEEIRSNHQLSSAGFASKIGVQRSAMSHILSGRNKPSLEFLMKIYEAFDEVGLEWLILGTSTPVLTKNKKKTFKPDDFDGDKSQSSSFESLSSEEIFVQNDQSKSSKEKLSPREIIYFYDDGSFERFMPKK